MNNTIKYASANKVNINFHHSGNNLLITYVDNGIGFDSEKIEKSLGTGLLNIQNRLRTIDSTFEINAKPGKGVKIKILTKY
ncbi:MAG: hypothetical protein HC905_20975 [Bacteroidales bacterium]|nr:hypothetical protein [Bacteroidales bacterium]